MKWIKKLLLFLYLSLQLITLSPHSSFAQGNDPSVDQEALEIWWESETLYKFLMDPSPNASGFFDFFEQFEGDPQGEAIIRDQLLKKYPSLRKFSQEGISFKSTYREMVRARIQEEHYGYHLFFTNYAIQRVLELSETIVTSQNEKPLNFRERESRALGHVAQRYGFPGGISAADLRRGIQENEGELSQHYENALLTYDRLMFFFEGETEKRNTFAPLRVEEILETIKNEIMEARLNNLRATIDLAKEKRAARNIRLKSKDGSSASAHDIGPILRIQEVSVGTETHKIVARGLSYSTDFQRRPWLRTVLGGWTNFSVPELKLTPWIRDFKLPRRFKAKNNKNSILIESESGRFILSRADFEKLLNELRLKKSDNPQAKRNKLLKRFQIEASARESLLADLYSLIGETQFQDTNSLLNRLEKYQNKIANEKNATDLSLSFVSSLEGKSSYSSLSFLNGLRWWGYSLHPGIWLRRELVAQNQLLPNIFKLKNGMAFKKLDSHQRAALKEERKQTKSWRASRGLRRWRIYRKILAGLVVLAPLFPGGMIDAAFDFFNSDKLQPAFEQPQEMQEQSNDDYIVSAQKLNGLKSLPLFRIFDFSHLHPSKTFHIASEDDIPSTALANDDPNSEGSSVILVEPKSLESALDGELNIRTEQFVIPLNGRLPIATFPGFDLTSIRLEKSEQNSEQAWQLTELKLGEDYKVYRVPENGLYYVELVDPQTTKITYIASFVKSNSSPAQISFSLNNETIQNLSLANYQIGARDLANALYRINQKYDELSLHHLSSIYAGNTVYTYTGRNDFEGSIGDDHPFKGLEQYSFMGHLWYQCTGAASHLESSLEYAFEQQEVPYMVQQISGYKYNKLSEEGYYMVTGDQGHRQVMVYHETEALNYQILDSTPYLTEPSWPDPIDIPQAYDEVFTLPEEIQEIRESSALTQERNERAKILFTEAMVVSKELGELAEQLGPNNQVFSNQRELRALPQTKLMAISRLLQEVQKGDLELSEGLFRIFLVSHGQFGFFKLRASQEWSHAYRNQVEIDGGYQNMVRSIFKKINEDMNQLYDGLDENADNSSLNPIQFLLSSPWRLRHQNLLQIVSALDLDALYDGRVSSLEYVRLSRPQCEESFTWSYQ